MGNLNEQKPWLVSYDPRVPANLEYPDKACWDVLEPVFEKYGDVVGIYYMGVPFDFKTLNAMSDKFVHFLRKSGLAKGDVVAINLPNIPAYYISALAVLKVGCVLCGTSPLLTAKELSYQLKDSGAKVLITLDALFPKVKQAAAGTSLKAIVFTGIADYLPPIMAAMGKLLKKIPTGKIEPIAGIDIFTFKHIMKNMPGDTFREAVGTGDTCALQYTGGTTGLPKGAELTHRNIVAQMIQIDTWLDMKVGAETAMSAFPLFHIAGLQVCLSMFCSGVTQVAVPNPRDQKFIISALKKYRPTSIANVPTVYMELMKHPDFKALDLSGVKCFVSAAAPFPPEYIREFEKFVGENKLVEVYGLTETSALITGNPLYGKKKPGTVGIPFPDTEIRIVDPATDNTVPAGEAGEIVARGPQVFSKGYFKKPQETEIVLRAGWFHTGDVGKMDDDGYITIVDRLKDMVNVSGFKVFTRELDDILCEHPDVDLGASVGIPDPERPGSELVASAIVLKPGIAKSEQEKEKIIEFLKVKVAPYKVPKKVEFYDELPTSGVGKILKRELKTMMTGKTKS
ncbi:MAG: AMP-binding protein [Dehalococcoidia bacterium]